MLCFSWCSLKQLMFTPKVFNSDLLLPVYQTLQPLSVIVAHIPELKMIRAEAANSRFPSSCSYVEVKSRWRLCKVNLPLGSDYRVRSHFVFLNGSMPNSWGKRTIAGIFCHLGKKTINCKRRRITPHTQGIKHSLVMYFQGKKKAVLNKLFSRQFVCTVFL